MDETYTKLRGLALGAVEQELIPASPGVAGVIVDIPAGGGMATLAALGPDTTSFYTSRGGGTIGAGATPAVAAASRALLETAGRHLDALAPDGGDGFPDAQTVRLRVLTAQGRLAADVPRAAFWGEAEHPLSALLAAAQEVITALRESGPRQRGEAPRSPH